MLHSNTICEEGEKSTGSATRPDPRKAIPSHPAGHHVMTCGAESMRAGADDTFLKVRCIHVSFFFKKNPHNHHPQNIRECNTKQSTQDLGYLELKPFRKQKTSLHPS